jgi:hypothetical protein
MEIERPTEFVDHLGYILLSAPDEYPYEDYLSPEEQPNNATAFAEAFRAMQMFIDSARTEEGREKLRECDRNLHVAFELYEKGDAVRAAHLVQDTEDMFQQCRKHIPISDE